MQLLQGQAPLAPDPVVTAFAGLAEAWSWGLSDCERAALLPIASTRLAYRHDNINANGE
jgi:hypothetical protein